MTGDEGDVAWQVEAALFLEHTHYGETHRHECRLGVLCQRELALWSLEHEPGELLFQGVVHLLEGVARHREGRGQITPHADRLGALSRKNQCPHHRPFPAPERADNADALSRKSALGAAESSACAREVVVYSAPPPCRASPG